jgi:hypothetical protein
MKQGTNNHLAVKFKGLDTSSVGRVEFVFSQTKQGDPLKTEEYAPALSGDVSLTNGVFYVPFSLSDTYLFKPDALFYMDTRITLAGNIGQDNPETPIVALRMNPTLFGPIDEEASS